jgi:hypothetical protein
MKPVAMAGSHHTCHMQRSANPQREAALGLDSPHPPKENKLKLN